MIAIVVVDNGEVYSFLNNINTLGESVYISLVCCGLLSFFNFIILLLVYMA